MTNSLSIQDWLEKIRDEYLDGFVKDGGSAIKFAVPAREDLTSLLQDRLAEISTCLGYLVVKVDSGETRVHMPQEIFFRIAQQIDWELMARRVVLRLCDDLPYQTGSIDLEDNTPIVEAISAANSVERSLVSLDLRRQLPQVVRYNRKMSRDFREAMTNLCLSEMADSGQNQENLPLLEWLTGRNRRVANVRSYRIYNTIVRTNARHFLESLLYWVRFVGYAGTVVILNNSRVTLQSNPRDGVFFYSRPAAMDHYELLREIIDSTDRLEGLFMTVLSNEGFLNEDTRGKGYFIYQALRWRIANEVRSRSQPNPMATLVRLSDSTI